MPILTFIAKNLVLYAVLVGVIILLCVGIYFCLQKGEKTKKSPVAILAVESEALPISSLDVNQFLIVTGPMAEKLVFCADENSTMDDIMYGKELNFSVFGRMGLRSNVPIRADFHTKPMTCGDDQYDLDSRSRRILREWIRRLGLKGQVYYFRSTRENVVTFGVYAPDSPTLAKGLMITKIEALKCLN